MFVYMCILLSIAVIGKEMKINCKVTCVYHASIIIMIPFEIDNVHGTFLI